MCSEVDQQVAKANSHAAETSLIPGIKIKIRKAPSTKCKRGFSYFKYQRYFLYFTTLFVAGSGKITAGLNDLASSKSINA